MILGYFKPRMVCFGVWWPIISSYLAVQVSSSTKALWGDSDGIRQGAPYGWRTSASAGALRGRLPDFRLYSGTLGLGLWVFEFPKRPFPSNNEHLFMGWLSLRVGRCFLFRVR